MSYTQGICIGEAERKGFLFSGSRECPASTKREQGGDMCVGIAAVVIDGQTFMYCFSQTFLAHNKQGHTVTCMEIV